MSDKSEKKDALIFFLLTPFLIGYAAWAWAVVVRKTWAWFLTTAWHLDPISFPQAVAISVCIGMVSMRASSRVDNKTDPWKMIIPALLFPWLCLGVNYLTYILFI